MPKLERTHTVAVEVDGPVDWGGLERAALEFARTAPAELVAATVSALVDELFDATLGPFGSPLGDEEQPEAPWECPGCGSTRGFRRRGQRCRVVASACGRVRLAARQVACRGCETRFGPVPQLLGLARYQRTSTGLSELAAGLAVEVAYAKASRLLADLAGVALSPRALRRHTLALAPERIGGGSLEVPVLLIDGTGVRAGTAKTGVGLHLAIGLFARRREAGRTVVEARLVAATLGEGWPVMAGLLEGVRPGLVVVDGEEELVNLAHDTFGGVPVQRCLWHLGAAMVKTARYVDRAPSKQVDAWKADLERLLVGAYRSGDEVAARERYTALVAEIEAAGACSAAHHLRAATDDALRFLTNPTAGRLVFGDRGRPELGTGVLERVMREMNRRTDVGVRWSIHGARGVCLLKAQRKYHTGPWAPAPEPAAPPAVRFHLVA